MQVFESIALIKTQTDSSRFIGPIFDQFSTQYTDVIFLKVDVDKVRVSFHLLTFKFRNSSPYQPVAQKYGVSAMPTFIFFKNGQKIHQFSGASKEQLERAIQSYSGTFLRNQFPAKPCY